MKLAVLKAKDTDNPSGMPDEWPTHCKEVADDYQAVGDEVLMTPEELQIMKAEQKSLYDAWYQDWQENVIKPSQWSENRVKEYPSVGDQLDMIWHTLNEGKPLDKTSEWFLSVKSVKDKYPKSDSGTLIS